MTNDFTSVYARACSLISESYALPEPLRERFIYQACDIDTTLRQEVAWLLEVVRTRNDSLLLTINPLENTLAAEEHIHIHVPSARDYQILECLGKGGMGTVYLAQRKDGELQQKVALKVLNIEAQLQQEAVVRFLSERQILAELNHPNIAHLTDGGSLPDGRPFIAMEYVDGIRIDDYCRIQKLPLNAVLKLFRKICDAVHHAHQRLVIHRDLKPQNILVTAEGEPKLLDFGIARLIDASPALSQTRTGGGVRLMTLAYASPEQISGRSLSTATDIFSLGVLLKELLTGRRPWNRDSPVELAKAICEEEPDAPSTLLRAQVPDTMHVRSWFGRARADIHPDVDAIVLKALRKEPAQRYGSVQELADDISNFMESRPVRARRGRLTYRAYKYAYRHRIALGWGAALLALSTTFAVDRQFQLMRTRTERNRAEQTRDVLLSVFASVDPDDRASGNVTPETLLDRGLAQVENGTGMDALTRAEALSTIASGYSKWGNYHKAISAFRAAWDVLNQINDDTPYNLHVSVARQLAYALQQNSQLDEAESWYQHAHEFAIKYLGANARETLTIERMKANFLQGWTSHRWNEVRQLLEHVATTSAVAFGENDPDTLSARVMLAWVILQQDGRAVDAANMVRGVLERLEATLPDSPLIPFSRTVYAEALLESKDFEEADKQIALAIEMSERKVGHNHSRILTKLDTRIEIALRTGNIALAQTLADSALSVLDKIRANADAVMQVSTLDVAVRALVWHPKRSREALTLANNAVDLAAATEGLSPVIRALAYRARAVALFYANRDLKAAREAIEVALKEGESFDDGYVNVDFLIRFYVLAASIADAQNDLDNALRYADTAIEKAGKSLPEANLVRANVLLKQHDNLSAQRIRFDAMKALRQLDRGQCSEDLLIATEIASHTNFPFDSADAELLKRCHL